MQARYASLPNQLILDLPDTLRADSTNSASSFYSPGTSLRDEITAAQLDITAIQIDLYLLSQHLTTTTVDTTGNSTDNSCVQESACELLDQQINVTVNADAEGYIASRPFSAISLNTSSSNTSSFNTNANLRTGDSVSFNNVYLQSGQAGYFDHRLQYNRSNGGQIVLQWSSDQQWVSVRALNTDSTMYSLLQTDSSEMTLRRTDHLRGDASVQLIAIQNHASIATDATYIEADLNNDEPFFVYAIGDATNGAIFSESLISDNTLYREATNTNGQLTDLETCVEPCTQWQSLLNSQRLPETFFDTNRNIIDAVSRTIINPVDSSILPDEVNEIAITIGDATNTANSPTNQPDSLVCGGQRLSDNVRIFCWQPTPFESPTILFEESRVNGSLTYRLITR